MSLSKKYLKTRPVSKVTFRLPREAAPSADEVRIVGDCNRRNPKATPMRRLKNGSFNATLDLDVGRAYAFRYLIDGDRWENDWAADGYEPTPYGDSDNSVVRV